jgi:hypothetical protein
MLKTTLDDAVAALREAVASMPAGLEARSDFFIQWRGRTIDLLERTFTDDHEPVRLLKEIEFSPRRLSGKDAKDEQLKLDAFLAGCDAAKSLLEGLVVKLTAPPPPAQPQAQAEVQGEVQTPAVMVDARPEPEPQATVAKPAAAQVAPAAVAQAAPAAAIAAAAPPAPAVAVPVQPAAASPPPAPVNPAPPMTVVTGGIMGTVELCAPVRTSFSRVLAAWDKGDKDMALVLSAQLLADLTVLSRDEKFKSTFDKVVSKSFENGAAEAVKSNAPLCIWSMVAAMNELMRAA